MKKCKSFPISYFFIPLYFALEISSLKMLSYYIVSSSSQKTLHFLVIHCIFYLTDYQIKTLKRKKCESFPHILFPHSSVLCFRGTCFSLLHFFFLLIWKDLRKLLILLVVFATQQKKQNEKRRRGVRCQAVHKIALISL